MTIVDRYLFFLFLKTFLICFVSFTGLYIVVHLFSNLDEMVALSTDGWPTLLYEFYGPRVAELFDKTAGILILVAAIFSVSLLQRRREFTAIEAAGITKARILRSVFLTAIVVIGLSIANREWLIPQVKDSLVRTPQTWSREGRVELAVQEDIESGVVLRGDHLFIGEQRITQAEVQLPRSIGGDVTWINAPWAILEPGSDLHPAGLRFHRVTSPKNMPAIPSMKSDEGQTIVFSPNDHRWLASDQCFVACDFNIDQMAYGTKLANYQTTPEMIAQLRKPRRWFGQGQQIRIHTRLLRPILDLTLLMLGLSVVIGSVERNVFVSVGICFTIVAALHLTMLACNTLGASSLIRPAALAAWLPVAVFFPFAVVAMRRLKS